MVDESIDPTSPPRWVPNRIIKPDIPLQGSTSMALAPKTRDVWHDQDRAPFVPSGYLSVPEAFDRVGRALFGEEWTGREGSYRGNAPRFHRPREVFDGDSDVIKYPDAYRSGWRTVLAILGVDEKQKMGMPVSNREWCEATDRWLALDAEGPLLERRRDTIVDTLHRALSDNAVVAALKMPDGEMRAVEPHVWNQERDWVWQRLILGSLLDPTWGNRPLLFDKRSVEEFAASQIALSSVERVNGNAAVLLSDRTGGQGRPSSMHIIEAQFRRRANAAELAESLAAEARHLHVWFRKQPEFSGLTIPTAKTITNRIRAQYREATSARK